MEDAEAEVGVRSNISHQGALKSLGGDLTQGPEDLQGWAGRPGLERAARPTASCPVATSPQVSS